MIPFEKALNIVLKSVSKPRIKQVSLQDSLDCILAENIYSDIDLPPFDRSAMDGFAINSKDTSEIFKVIEDIPAGYVPKKRVGLGQAARIMTGAMVPKGADKVIKVEDTQIKEPANKLRGSLISLIKPRRSVAGFIKSNISKRGEDVIKGQLILRKGTLIRPQEGAMLATVGKTTLKVYTLPKVGIISTGSELVEPEKKPKAGQIRNSNGPMQMLQLKKLGIEGKYFGIAKDNFSKTVSLIKQALKEVDILLLSGGVSVGDYDFVEEALKKCGVKILFNKIAIKPGKPTTFGKKGDKVVFGLPGNPVSVLVIFELLVHPFIDHFMERKSQSEFCSCKLMNDFKRRSGEREQYYPIVFKKNGVIPIEFHGSAHMLALTEAQGIMRVPAGVLWFKKGSKVDARSI